MLGCWVVCLAAGYVISGDAVLGVMMLGIWHIAMTVMVNWWGIEPEVPDGNRRT